MVEKKRVKRTKSIVTGHLEKIGAKVFDDFSSVITDIIKGHQGIYALFKKDGWQPLSEHSERSGWSSIFF